MPLKEFKGAEEALKTNILKLEPKGEGNMHKAM